MNQGLSIKCGGIAFEANMLSRTIYVAPCHVPEALGAVLESFEDMADDSALCQALAEHLDLADLAARVAAVAQIRRKLADHDLTSAERTALDQLAADPCEWIRNEAKCALDELSDPLRDQDAEHDGTVDDSAHFAELDFICFHGLTDERHARLNWLRANGSQEVRARAGNLLISLAGAAK